MVNRLSFEIKEGSCQLLIELLKCLVSSSGNSSHFGFRFTKINWFLINLKSLKIENFDSQTTDITQSYGVLTDLRIDEFMNNFKLESSNPLGLGFICELKTLINCLEVDTNTSVISVKLKQTSDHARRKYLQIISENSNYLKERKIFVTLLHKDYLSIINVPKITTNPYVGIDTIQIDDLCHDAKKLMRVKVNRVNMKILLKSEENGILVLSGETGDGMKIKLEYDVEMLPSRKYIQDDSSSIEKSNETSSIIQDIKIDEEFDLGYWNVKSLAYCLSTTSNCPGFNKIFLIRPFAMILVYQILRDPCRFSNIVTSVLALDLDE